VVAHVLALYEAAVPLAVAPQVFVLDEAAVATAEVADVVVADEPAFAIVAHVGGADQPAIVGAGVRRGQEQQAAGRGQKGKRGASFHVFLLHCLAAALEYTWPSGEKHESGRVCGYQFNAFDARPGEIEVALVWVEEVALFLGFELDCILNEVAHGTIVVADAQRFAIVRAA